MWATKRTPARRRIGRDTGSFIIEFTMILLMFLVMVFGVIELIRYMYVVNTLQEVTRRAASLASNIDFTNASAKSQVRTNAVFRTSSGGLVLGDPVTDDSIRIDYLAIVNSGGGSVPTPIDAASLPSSPGRNRFICKAHPNDAGCIRLVRVRVCAAAVADACVPVQYKTIFPLISFPIDLPISSTIVTAETLGFTAGMTASN